MRRLWQGLKDLTIAVPLAAVVEHFMPMLRRIPWHVVLRGIGQALLDSMIGLGGAVLFCFVFLVMLVCGEWIGEKML